MLWKLKRAEKYSKTYKNEVTLITLVYSNALTLAL